MRRRVIKSSRGNGPLPPSGSMALILVDGRQIRREFKEEYEKVVRDLAKAREELDRFQQQDTPRFSRWINSQFGALLTELRETSQKLQDCDNQLAEMESEVIFLGVSPGRAYQRVMNRRRQEQEPEVDEENEEPSEGRRNEQRSGPDYNGDPFGQDELPPSRRRQQPKRREIGARLKEIYRALVRRLHPDMQTTLSRKRLEWWHQAQEAYQKGDEEQLEVILTLCEIEEAGTVEKTSLSVLQRITRQFKKTLRQLKRQVEQSRKDPAWRFSVRKDLATLAASMKQQFMRDLNRMREELQMLEEQLAAWAAQARRPRRPVYRRKHTADPFF